MFVNSNKAISPVVATSLLLVVAVVAVSVFQGWFGIFSSGLTTDVSIKAPISSIVNVEGFSDDELYIVAKKDVWLDFVKIVSGNGSVCVDAFIPDDTLIGHWKLDGDAADDGVLGNDGTIIGALSATGKYGGGYSFNGNDDVIRIPDHADYDFNHDEDFSFFLWFKNNNECLSADFSGNEVFASRNSGGTIDWWLGCGGTFASHPNKMIISFEVGGMNAIGDKDVNDDVWHHAGWTYDGSTKTLRLYLDGELEDSATNSSFNYNMVSSEKLCLGGYQKPDCNNYNANATLDEARAYNRTLSDDEVYALYMNFLRLNEGLNSIDVSSCSLVSGGRYNVVGAAGYQFFDVEIMKR